MTYFNQENFGKRLAACRKAMGLQQSEICVILGCSNGAYSLYERSKRQPTLSVFFALSDQFGISLDYLFGCFSPSPHIFAERLNDIVVKRKDKSLDEFLEINEINRAAGALFLSGTCFPNSKVLARLCTFFDCSADYLIGLSVTPSRVSIPIKLDLPPMPRDPLDNLLPEYRQQAETYLAFLRQQQAAQLSASKEEA